MKPALPVDSIVPSETGVRVPPRTWNVESMPWNVNVAVFAPDPRVTELVPDPMQDSAK
ncbi:MAG TPA: hypothetical protein VHJ77_04995 [Vicinamibacterales bacterium]|nr:hypothetical protein [Vicinamibacterales bacterium]